MHSLAWMALTMAGCQSGVFIGSGEDDGGPSHPVISVDDTGDTADTAEPTGNGVDVPNWNLLFADDYVMEIELTISDESYQALVQDPFTYTRVRMELLDETLDVGVRLKGSSTYDSIQGKPSLKVQIDRYDQSAEIFGVESFNLHNLRYDPSLMAESIAYRVYREAGVPAPRVGYAAVVINGQYKGLYSIVEQKNEEFIRMWWDGADDEGTLYEGGWSCDLDFQGGSCGCMEIDREGVTETAELQALCHAATLTGDDFYAAITERLDWKMFMHHMALDAVLAHWDSYGGNLNNWHLYHAPEQDKWSMSPWSTDLAFGWNPWDWTGCGSYGTNPYDYGQGVVMQTCLMHTGCRADYELALHEMAEHVASLDTSTWITEQTALVEPYITKETQWAYNSNDFQQQVGCIQQFLLQRPDVIHNSIPAP